MLIIKLMFVREFSKTPCKGPLQTEVEVTLEEFNGTKFSQYRTFYFLQNIINGTVPSVDSFQAKLERQGYDCRLHCCDDIIGCTGFVMSPV